jgi:protein farnesyltransferase subunit beta
LASGSEPAAAAAAAADDDDDNDLWSRTALARYILSCCQGPHPGGLRDKPSKRPDAYHSCYNLAGLSAAQNEFVWDDSTTTTAAGTSKHDDDGERSTAEQDGKEEGVTGPLSAPYGWVLRGQVGGEWEDGDRVRPVHPVFVVPAARADACRRYFDAGM